MARFQPAFQRSPRTDLAAPDVAVLPAIAVRRLSTQIGRAFRGTYGANAGLRTIVQATARELLLAGATPHAVARAFAECVERHLAHLASDQREMTTKVSSAGLVAVTRECVALVALELGKPL